MKFGAGVSVQHPSFTVQAVPHKSYLSGFTYKNIVSWSYTSAKVTFFLITKFLLKNCADPWLVWWEEIGLV